MRLCLTWNYNLELHVYYENIGFKIVITYLPNAYVLAKKHIHVSSHTYETYLVEINFYYCYFFSNIYLWRDGFGFGDVINK